jgi:hypothetical protein
VSYPISLLHALHVISQITNSLICILQAKKLQIKGRVACRGQESRITRGAWIYVRISAAVRTHKHRHDTASVRRTDGPWEHVWTDGRAESIAHVVAVAERECAMAPCPSYIWQRLKGDGSKDL